MSYTTNCVIYLNLKKVIIFNNNIIISIAKANFSPQNMQRVIRHFQVQNETIKAIDAHFDIL